LYLTLLEDWEQLPSLFWLDSTMHGLAGSKSGNLAKKCLSKAFFKSTCQSLATGRELLASTLMPPLMPSPVKLKTNHVIQMIAEHVWEF